VESPPESFFVGGRGVIRSVELIVHPEAKDGVGEMVCVVTWPVAVLVMTSPFRGLLKVATAVSNKLN
jgi:hypothetical protein